MTDYDLLIAGDLVTPDGVVRDGWLAIAGGTIRAVGSGDRPAAREIEDARGEWVLPGVIDGQTHAGSATGFDGLEPTTRSAAAGGVTTIVDMPYDNPDPVNSVAVLEQKAEAVHRLAHVDTALYGTVAKDAPAGTATALAEAGVAAIKLSLYESHPQRFPRIPKPQLMAVLEEMRDAGLPVGLHNEDQELVDAHVARMKAAGRTGADAHHPSRPEVAEILATADFFELGRATGAHVHIVHFSQALGYELVRQYQEQGVAATGELCVHYLVFDESDVRAQGNVLKVNPPIRPDEKDGIWAMLEAGLVAFVSSDHGSWPYERKAVDDVFQAAAGIPGLETLLPAFYDVCMQRDAAIEMVADFLAERPARFFGLWPRKGGLRPGADADVAVLDPTPYTFDQSTTHDDLNWSPYHGRRFAGGVERTFVRGRKVFERGRVLSEPGHGRFVKREA